MRIVFMGSPEEVIKPLEILRAHCQSSADELIGIVSQPAKPAGRKRLLADPPVASYAKKEGLMVWQPERARDEEFLQQMREAKVDLFVTAAYGQILTDTFLEIPRVATINIHPSLIPKYRGATPVQTALLEGCATTGVTVLFTVRALDAGNIIVQESTPIEPDETTATLLPRLFELGGKLLIQAIKHLDDPEYTGTPQKEEEVTYCRKISKGDGLVNWSLTASEIVNRFRAFDPWPGSFSYFAGKRIVFGKMFEDESETLDEGVFEFDKKEKIIRIGTGKGCIGVYSLKPEGKKMIDAPSFWNGCRNQETKFHDLG